MSRTKRAIHGILTSYLNYLVLIIVQIYISPMVLRKYGQETLGAYASIIQLVGYLTILEAALSITFNRFIAQAFSKNESTALLNKILFNGSIIYLAVGFIGFIVLVFTSFFVSDIFHISKLLEADLRFALIILGFFSLIKAPFSIYTPFLNGSQNMAFLNIVATLSSILRGGLILMFLYLDTGIKGIVLGNCISELILTLVSYLYFKLRFHDFKISFNNYDRVLFQDVLSFSKDSLIIQLTTKLRMGTDTLLVGIFISVTVASVFYSSITPPLMCFTVANLLMNSTLPGMNEIIGMGDIERIKSIYFRLLKYVVLMSIAVFFGIAILNKYVVMFWVGIDQYVGWEINLLFALYAALLIIGSYNGNFLISMGIINRIAKAATIMAIGGLVLSIILISHFGILGLMLSSLLIMIPGNIYTHWQVSLVLDTNLLFQPAKGKA